MIKQEHICFSEACHPRKRSAPNQKGFSLTEILIVIGLISLLILAALPNLRSNGLKANRQDAYTSIAETQSALLQYYAVNQTFEGYTPTVTNSSRNLYQVTVSSQTVSNYVITATAQAEQQNDEIRSFRVNAAERKEHSKKSAPGTFVSNWDI